MQTSQKGSNQDAKDLVALLDLYTNLQRSLFAWTLTCNSISQAFSKNKTIFYLIRLFQKSISYMFYNFHYKTKVHCFAWLQFTIFITRIHYTTLHGYISQFSLQKCSTLFILEVAWLQLTIFFAKIHRITCSTTHNFLNKNSFNYTYYISQPTFLHNSIHCTR